MNIGILSVPTCEYAYVGFVSDPRAGVGDGGGAVHEASGVAERHGARLGLEKAGGGRYPRMWGRLGPIGATTAGSASGRASSAWGGRLGRAPPIVSSRRGGGRGRPRAGRAAAAAAAVCPKGFVVLPRGGGWRRGRPRGSRATAGHEARPHEYPPETTTEAPIHDEWMNPGSDAQEAGERGRVRASHTPSDSGLQSG